jgi:PBP1b-binding outer membrane lipoprotein LpoB
MKTSTASAQNNTLRNILAGLTLSAAIFFGGTASAQSVKFVDNAPIHTQTTDGFKVAVYPVVNSMFMKVHVENPSREKVTVLVKNSKGEIVYRKAVGNNPIFTGKFDVSQVEDGTYTMVIQSAKQSYANPFYVDTNQDRIAKAF